jgi:hypothetical protein
MIPPDQKAAMIVFVLFNMKYNPRFFGAAPPMKTQVLLHGDSINFTAARVSDKPGRIRITSAHIEPRNPTGGSDVMSALGQKRTCAVQKGMSALPPKANTSAS